MISHKAVRLALRARLRTLSVATTGSTSLAATSTGYTRAAGSFLTDGFAVGQEITPTGFTQTARGTIEALTPTVMTIRGGRTAQAEGAGRSLTVGLPASQVWENLPFEPATGVPYVVEQYIPGPAKRISIGPNAELEYLPMYAPQIHVPAGSSVEAADSYADALLALFAPGQSITIANGTLHVRGDVAPFSGQLLQSTAGHAVVPVTIPLRLRTTNVI